MNDQFQGAGGHWQRPEDLVGTILNDRFRVIKIIGDGGMGSVYLAEHVTLRKKVALKVLKHELCREQTHVDRFLQEARAASMIQHENIVDIVDFGPVPGGSVFFAMEYLDGEDLSQVLRRERRLPWARTRELMLQIVRALTAAHACGIVHRDLKPANCFLQKRSDGRDFVKLLDFGIAKVTDESGEGGGLTRTGAVFGTAKYMAPEQAMGDPADARTDIYAAAICMYEFLTGQVPYDGDNFMRVLSRHLTEALTLPSTMAPDAKISPIVEAIIVKALSKKPDDRYQSMVELEAAIFAVGPDGRLSGGHDVGPPMMARPHEGPGRTMWMGDAGAPGPASQPPDARGGTMMLDPNAMPMDPSGTVRLGADWGTSSPPPPMVPNRPDATFMMDGAAPDMLQHSGGVITRNPPVGSHGGAPGTYPPARGAQHPDTRPPAFHDQTRNPDATVFAVEQRSKVGFILMLVMGGVVAVGGGGFAAYLMVAGDDADETPAVAADTRPTKPEVKDEPKAEPSGPNLVEQPPDPVPDPVPDPKTPDPVPDPVPDPKTPDPVPDPTPDPTPKTPKTPKQPPKEEIKKTLSDADISKGIQKAAGAVKTCKGPLPIKINVAYKITADGRAKVNSVTKSGGGSLAQETRDCVKKAVESKAKFPKNSDFKLPSFTF